jgi:hypothetical protein
MGHRSHFGLVSEIDRFGTKMALVQVPDVSNNPSSFVAEFEYGGSAVFSFTVMTEEAVKTRLRAEAEAERKRKEREAEWNKQFEIPQLTDGDDDEDEKDLSDTF